MSKFWQTQKFKQLHTEWKKKLKEAGFEDIEDEKQRLKQNASNAYRTTAPEHIEEKATYYRVLCGKFHKEKFKSEFEKMIMERWVSGAKIKEICHELKTRGQRYGRNTIGSIVRRYERKWGIQKRQSKAWLKFTPIPASRFRRRTSSA